MVSALVVGMPRCAVMAAAGLGGAAMTAPVVGNHPETVARKKTVASGVARTPQSGRGLKSAVEPKIGYL
jgi:hypothetical protein